MTTSAKKRTRGRPPRDGEARPASVRMRESRDRLIGSGGIVVNSVKIRDPKLASQFERLRSEAGLGKAPFVERIILEWLSER